MAGEGKRKAAEGCWVVVNPANGELIIERSETAALRVAVATKGDMNYVKYGEAFVPTNAPSVPDENPQPTTDEVGTPDQF